MADLRFSTQITADTTGFVGGIRVSEKEFKKFVNELDKAEEEFKSATKETTSFLKKLRDINKFQGFRKISDGLRNVRESFVKNIKAAGDFIFALKNIVSAATSIASAFASPITTGAQFESVMSQIEAISGSTRVQMEALTSTARQLGSETKYSATQAGEGMKFLSLAGFSANQTIAAMPGLLNLAAASGEDLARVSDIASDQLSALKLEASEMTRVADVFAKAQATANTTVSMLGDSMKYSAPVFTVAQQSMETLVASTALLANVGIKGSSSGTALRMAIGRLADPPKAAAKALNALGIKVTDNQGNFRDFSDILKQFSASLGPTIQAVGGLTDANGNLRDMSEIMTEVKKSGKGAADQIAAVSTIFGVEASTAMLELISQSQVVSDEFGNKLPTAFERYRAGLENSTGTAQKMSDIMMDNLLGDWQTLQSTTEELMLTIYDAIQPVLRSLVQGMIENVGQLTAFIRGFFATMSSFGAGISAGLAPVGKALEVLSVAFQPLQTALQPLFTSFSEGSKNLTLFQSAAFGLGKVLGTIVSLGVVPLVEGLRLLAPLFNSGAALVNTFVNGIVSQGSGIFNAILSIFDKVAALFPHSNAEMGPFSSIYESGQALLQTFAEGILSVGSYLFNALNSSFASGISGINAALVGMKVLMLSQLIFAFTAIGNQSGATFLKALLNPMKKLASIVSSVLGTAFKIFSQVLMPALNLSTSLANVLLNMSLVAIQVTTSLGKLVKTFGLLGVAGVFIYEFHDELVNVASSLMALDFSEASAHMRSIFSQMGEYWRQTWTSAQQFFEGTFIGEVMNAAEQAVAFLGQTWGRLSPQLQSILTSTGAVLAGFGAILSRLPLRDVINIVSDVGKTVASLSPLGKGLLLITGLVGKFFILWKQYPEQVQTVISFIKDSFTQLREQFLFLMEIAQGGVDKISGNISVLNTVIQAFLVYMTPFPATLKAALGVIGLFDLLALKIEYTNDSMRNLTLGLGAFVSGIGIAIVSANPLIAVLSGVVSSLIVFREEISTILNSAITHWSEVWDSMSDSTKAVVIGIGGLAIAIAGFATGLISIPAVIIGAIGGGIAALGSFKDEILTFWDSVAETWGPVIIGLGAVITAGLAIALKRAIQAVSVQKLAKECVKNPLTKCFFPDRKALERQLKSNQSLLDNSFLKGKTSCPPIDCSKQYELLRTNASKSANDVKRLTSDAMSNAIKNYERNVTEQTRLLSRQSNVARQSAESTRKTWLGAITGIASSMTNAFKSAWNSIVSTAQQAVKKMQSYASEARWTGTGHSDRRSKQVLDRTDELAQERGVTKYQQGRYGKTQTEEYRKLKDEAIKQSQATRNILQSIVTDFGASIKSFVSNSTSAMRRLAASTANAMGQFWDASTRTFAKTVDKTKNLAKGTSQHMGGIWQSLKQHAINTLNTMQATTAKAMEGMKRLASGTANAMGQFWDASTQRFAKAANSTENAVKSSTQRMSGIWDNLKQKSASAIASAQENIRRYVQMTRSSNEQFTSPSPSPAAAPTNSNFDRVLEEQTRRQQNAMRKLSNTTAETANNVGQSFDRMGEHASGYTTKLKKAGFAAAAVAGVTFAFSGAANAAENLNSLTQSTSLLDKAISKLNEAWQWLKTNVDTVALVGLTVLTSGLIDLGTAISILTQAAGVLTAAFVGWKIGEFLYNEFEIVRESAITVVGVFVELGNAIGQAYTDITSIDFGTLGESIIDSISNVFSDGIPQIKESLNDIWSGLGDVFVFPAELVGNLSESVGGAIGEAIGAISEGNFAEAGAIVVNGILDGLSDLGTALSSVLNGGLKMALDAILPGPWAEKATTIIDSFANAISSAGSFIVNSVQTIIASAGQYLSSVSWSNLGRDILNTFVSVITLQPLLAAAQGMINGAKNYLNSVSWSGEGQGLMATLANGLRAAGGLLIAGIKGAIQGVISYVSSIDLSAAGRKMLSTMGEGIKQAAAGLKSQVSNTLSSVRNLLPFSDAKEGPLSTLTKSGEAIPETLAKGIQNNSKSLTDSAEKTFKKLQETVANEISSLEKQKTTIGFSSEQLKIYELQQQGVAEATLEKIGVLQSEVATQKALHEAAVKLQKAQMTPEQLDAQKLAVQGVTEANIASIQVLNAQAEAFSLLSKTQEKLNAIGKNPEQIQLENLAQRGVSQSILEQVSANQIAIEVAEKRYKLEQQVAYAGLDSYEKELKALERKGASQEQLNSIIELRTELEQKKNNTVLQSMDRELTFLQMSKEQQEEFNILKKFGHEYATEAQKQELLEKHDLIKAQKEQNKLFSDIQESATGYFDKVIDGSVSAKDAFRDFANDMKNTWTKSLAEMAKQQLQNFDFGKMFSGGKGLLGSITGMFSGGGKGGGLLDSITGMFSGGGKGLSSILSGGGITDALGGLGSSITNLVPSVKNLTGSLGGLGGGMGMGALSAGMSLLQGDTAGAITGIASLAGSMTPLGPLGGMAASALAGMVGIGAEWVREAEWIVADIRGTTATFKKGYREVKDSMIGGGSRIGYEELEPEQLAELNKQFKAISSTVETVNQSLGDLDINLMQGMTDFVAHVEDREGLGGEVFAQSMQEVQRRMITHAIDNLMIAGVDDDATKTLEENVSDMVSGRVKDLMAMFTDVNAKIDFDMAVTDSTWNGDLDRILGQFEVNSAMYHEKLTTGLNEFIASMDMGDMGADQIQAQLAEKTAQMFKDVGVNDIPQSTFDELSAILAARISDAILFVEQGIGEFAVTEDTGFFKTLKDMVRNFEGNDQELQKFIDTMIGLKESAKSAGLNTDILTESLITAAGGVDQLASQVSFFEDKFVNEAQKQSAELNSSIAAVSNVMSNLNGEVPKTREQFAQLVQSTSQLGQEGQQLSQSLLQAAPAFDTYYKFIEQLGIQTAQTFGQLQQNVTQSFAELGLAVPSTRQQFHELISSLDITTQAGQQLFQALSESAPAVDQLFSALENVFTIDAASLGQNLMDAIFNASSAEEAGAIMAGRFAEQFYQQMIGSIMNSVAQTIFSGVVQPFLNSSAQAAISLNEGSVVASTNLANAGNIASVNLGEGSAVAGTNLTNASGVAGTSVSVGGANAATAITAGGQLAADALASIVEDVKQKIQIMAKVMRELKEEGVMEEIQNALSDVGSFAFETVQATPAAQFQAIQTQAIQTVATPRLETQPIIDSVSSVQSSFNEFDTQPAVKQVETFQSVVSEPVVEAEANEPVVEAIAAEAQVASFVKLRSQLDVLNKDLDGNAATLYELQQRYKDTDAAQLLVLDSSQSLIGSIQNLSDQQLETIAKQANVSNEGYDVDLTSDLVSTVSALKAQEQELGQVRDQETQAMTEQLNSFQGLRNQLVVFDENLEGNAATLYELQKRYQDTDAAQLFNVRSAQELSDAVKNLTDEQMSAITEQAKGADFAGDAIAAVNALQEQEEQLVEARQAETLVLDEQLAATAQFNQDIRKQITELSLSGQELDLFNLEQEYQQAQTEAKEQQADLTLIEELYGKKKLAIIQGYRDEEIQLTEEMNQSLNELRFSIENVVSPMGETQQVLQELGQEFLGVDGTMLAVDADLQQLSIALENVPNEHVIEFAKRYGYSVDDLSGKLLAAVEATQRIQGMLSASVSRMSQIATGASDAELELERLAGKYQGAGELIAGGAGEQDVASYFAGLGEKGLAELAKQQGVGIEELLEDADSFVSALGEIRSVEAERIEEEKAREVEQQARQLELTNTTASLNTEMAQTVSGISDVELNLQQLGDKYSVFSDYLSQAGLTSSLVAEQFQNISQTELASLAEMANVNPEEFAADVSSYIGSMQSLESDAANVTREAEESAQAASDTVAGFRTEMEKLSSGMSDAEWVISQTSSGVKEFLNSMGSSSSELERALAEMDNSALLEAAQASNLSADEFVKSTSSYIDALKDVEAATRQTESATRQEEQESLQAKQAAAEEITRLVKERDDEIMKNINDLFATFEKLSEGIKSVQERIQENVLSFASAEQLAARRQAEMRTLGQELNTFNGADINRGDDMSAIIEKSDRYRELLMEETNAKLASIEEEKQIAQQAFEEQISQYQAWAESVQSIIKSVSGDIQNLQEELGGIGESAEQVKNQLAEQFNAAIDFDSQIELAGQYQSAIREALQENITAVEQARDERIAALEKERDTALENLRSQNEAAKQLRGELEAIKDQIGGLADSVGDDIARIRKEMKAPGTSAREQLAQMGNLPTGRVADESNLQALEQRRVLIVAAMEEQIALEENRVQKIQEVQQNQREHYQSLIDFSKELKGWVDNLALSDLSTLKPVEMLREAERQYQDTLEKAKKGDNEAQAKLSQLADEYLKQARDVYASSTDYTNIFKGVRSDMSGLAVSSETEANRIQAELPFDETESGQNISAIHKIQEQAIAELKKVDAALNTMESGITAQLASPSATPLPDEQLDKMLSQEEARFTRLIENENLNAEKQIAAYKEGAIQELTALNETLNGIYGQLEAEAEKQFDETPFAQNIQAVQATALLQLNQLGGFMVALDAGLKQSLNDNVQYLQTGLSMELQLQVGNKLDELIGVSRGMLSALGKENGGSKLGVLGGVLSRFNFSLDEGMSEGMLAGRRQDMLNALENYKGNQVGTFSNEQYDMAMKYVNGITDGNNVQQMLAEGIQRGSQEFWKLIEDGKTITKAPTSSNLQPPTVPSLFDAMPMGQTANMGTFDLLNNLSSMSFGNGELQEKLSTLANAADAIVVKLQELFNLSTERDYELNELVFEQLQTLFIEHMEHQTLLLTPLSQSLSALNAQYPVELLNNTLLLDDSIKAAGNLITFAINESTTALNSLRQFIQQPVDVEKEVVNSADDQGEEPVFHTGTSYVKEDMKANVQQGEIIVDSASSDILRRYGISVKQQQTRRDNNNDLERIEVLLQQLLAAMEKNSQQSSQNSRQVRIAVQDLENTVGKPIRKAIEDNRVRKRN